MGDTAGDRQGSDAATTRVDRRGIEEIGTNRIKCVKPIERCNGCTCKEIGRIFLRTIHGDVRLSRHRIVEEVDGGHRHHNSVALAGRLKLADDAIAFGTSGIDRYKVVVVQVYAPGANLSEQSDDVIRRNRRPDSFSEWIASAIAYRPQAKRKFVFRFRIVISMRHRNLRVLR